MSDIKLLDNLDEVRASAACQQAFAALADSGSCSPVFGGVLDRRADDACYWFDQADIARFLICGVREPSVPMPGRGTERDGYHGGADWWMTGVFGLANGRLLVVRGGSSVDWTGTCDWCEGWSSHTFVQGELAASLVEAFQLGLTDFDRYALGLTREAPEGWPVLEGEVA